jgi:hypothetical protein|tara:strand:+ start:878 stop:2686 length:1809 start_codon:yes stop_codon:yes gene_type:complete
MAVQQLGRDQARTLTDIIRGVSNVGGGIDEALQVVPGLGSATPATPVTKRKISAYDPTADYGLDSEMSGNIDIEGDNVTQSFGKDAGTLGDMIGSIFQYQGPGSQSFQRELASQKPQFVKPQISQMTEQERREMEADERVGIDDQLKALSDSLSDRPADTVPSAVSGAFGGDDAVTQTTTSEFQSGVRDTPEFGVDNVPTKDEQDSILEETFAKSMKDYLDALKGEDTDVKSIEEYKKEFADATGISIDGKPDKSAALMSFGLALMQNKAGKGFNIGRMLSAVGEAGEKAMPAFQQAKKEAKAEQLAAGKYALDSRAAALTKAASTRQAIADRVAELSDRAYNRETEIQIQELKGRQSMAEKKLAEGAANLREEIKLRVENGELGKPTEINLGGEGDEKFDVTVQQKGKTNEFKIIAPDATMGRIDRKIQSAEAGLKTVQKMQDLSREGETVGFKGIYTRMADSFKGLFSIPAVEEGSKVEQYRAAVGKMLVTYRKLLTGGEAGNAISDRDVQIIQQNLGLPKGATEVAFTSANQVQEYLSQLDSLFKSRKELFVGQKEALIEFGKGSGYYTEEAKDDDHSDDYLQYVPQVVGGKLRLTLPK